MHPTSRQCIVGCLPNDATALEIKAIQLHETPHWYLLTGRGLCATNQLLQLYHSLAKDPLSALLEKIKSPYINKNRAFSQRYFFPFFHSLSLMFLFSLFSLLPPFPLIYSLRPSCPSAQELGRNNDPLAPRPFESTTCGGPGVTFPRFGRGYRRRSLFWRLLGEKFKPRICRLSSRIMHFG